MSWEKVNCDLCGSNDLKPFLKEVTTWEHKGKFNYVKCQNCNLVSLSPRPKADQLNRYYSSDTYWGSVDIKKNWLMDDKWKQNRAKKFSHIYEGILKSYSKPASILDIGCGTSGFLTFFSEKGWKVLGTDISPEVASFSEKNYHFPVVIGDFLNINLNSGSFDVITFNHSLEHLYNPRKTLETIYRSLNKNGLLIISIPNVESLGFKIFGKDWYALQPPRHLYQFSPKTIRSLLKNTGFRVNLISHFDWQQNYYSLYESFRFKFSPRFKKADNGGLIVASYRPSLFWTSVIKEVGKIFDIIFSTIIVFMEAFLKRGETITIYAQKS